MLEDLANIPAHNHERKKAAPKESWRPHLDIDPDKGGYFVSSPRTPEESPDHAELLAEFDLNPDDWRVLNVRRSKWQSFNGEWLEAFRVNIAPKGAQSFGVDASELEKEIAKWRPPKNVKPVTGNLTAIFASGDTQWGKDAGDGSEGTVRRVRQGITESVERFKEIKGRGIGQIALPQLGDCIEGVVSQGGKIAGRLDLDLTSQIRVGRRVLLEWVKAFAPLTDKLIIPVVPGNHDESHRQLITDPVDSWQVEIVQQVLDIAKENENLQHVEARFPHKDNTTLALDLSGTLVGFAHGHQIRDAERWFAGQALGQTPVGSAEVLITGHYHHYQVKQIGPRLWIQIPSLDGGSPWFKDRRGLDSWTGLVSLVVGDGYDPRRDLVVLSGERRDA
jgi:predicted phosphodiesterase